MWKDTGGVNSLLCGPAYALTPPPLPQPPLSLMKPVITKALLIRNETGEAVG